MKEKNITTNINRYLIYMCFSRALFYLPIFIIFYNELGVPYSIVMLFFSILSLVKFLLEVPSGSFADNIGRKKTLIISIIFKIISLFLLVILSLFSKRINVLGYIAIILSTICFGLGEVLESGAADALMYDYLKFYNRENVFTNVAARANSLIFFSFSATGIIGGILYSINKSLPYISTLVAFVSAYISIRSFDEVKLEIKSKQNSSFLSSNCNTILKSFKMLKYEKYLINIMFYGAFLFSYFMLVTWQFQILFKDIKLNVLWFGVIFGILNLVSSLISRLYPYIEEIIGIKQSLYSIPIVFSLAYFVLACTSNLYVVILMAVIIYSLWGYSVPMYSNFLNKNISSETRSTMISIQSLFKSIIYGILSPLLGFLIDLYKIKNIFLFISLLILVTLLISVSPIKFLKE